MSNEGECRFSPCIARPGAAVKGESTLCALGLEDCDCWPKLPSTWYRKDAMHDGVNGGQGSLCRD